MSFDHQYYQRLESDLERLLLDLSSELSDPDAAEVRSFIDAGEYGVAFETLCDVIVERGVVIPRDAHERMTELAGRMDIEKRFWSELKSE
ncbi:MAG TPA: MafI family immunity protein [Planctomycetaceae bacterium]|jgi:hypothetical protein|nr:MafI family immunity protein [Planctomycetaceae bacterium]